MWPANITRGRPPGLTVARELPLTSACTSPANPLASVRQSRAGAASKAEGPGVSRRVLRNERDSGLMAASGMGTAKGRGGGPGCLPLIGAQRQLQKDRAVDRIGPVGRDRAESQRLVECPGPCHRGESVESHLAVARSPRFLDDAL